MVRRKQQDNSKSFPSSVWVPAFRKKHNWNKRNSKGSPKEAATNNASTDPSTWYFIETMRYQLIHWAYHTRSHSPIWLWAICHELGTRSRCAHTHKQTFELLASTIAQLLSTLPMPSGYQSSKCHICVRLRRRIFANGNDRFRLSSAGTRWISVWLSCMLVRHIWCAKDTRNIVACWNAHQRGHCGRKYVSVWCGWIVCLFT